MTQRVDIRCPVGPGPRRLFVRLIQSGGKPKYVDGNLMEFACSDCRRELQRAGEEVEQVFHRFNILGELIETEVVPRAE